MQVAATGASSCMSPAVQKGPLGDLHANGPSPREERVEATPRRLTQGATARLGDLALLRSILLRMAKRVLPGQYRQARAQGRSNDESSRMMDSGFPAQFYCNFRRDHGSPGRAVDAADRGDLPGFRRPAPLAV
jgi:hypothetical protein